MRKWTATGFLLIGLGSACAETAPPEEQALERGALTLPARREHLTVIHYNIAGATRSRGKFPIIGRIIDEVRARQPDILSINEICGNQFNHLVEQLQQLGYAMAGSYHAALKLNPTCGLTDSDGNAVFVRGASTRTDRYYFDGNANQTLRSGTNAAPLAVRWQTVVCQTVRFNEPGEPVKVCVTHLRSKESGSDIYRTARRQVAELVRVFGPEARQMPFVLAGDLNIPLNEVALDSLYNQDLLGDGPFTEIATTIGSEDDGASERRGEPTQGDNKIDYAFVSRHFFPDVAAAGVAVHAKGCPKSPCSDHRMLFGAFRWVGHLKVLNSNLCLVARVGFGEVPVVQVPCDAFSDQDWVLRALDGTSSPEGSVQVMNRDRRLCLVTRGINRESSAVVSTCDTSFPDQIWTAVRDANTGYYQLKNQNSGLCLVVRSNNPEQQAIQSTCGTQWADQLWLWDAWFR